MNANNDKAKQSTFILTTVEISCLPKSHGIVAVALVLLVVEEVEENEEEEVVGLALFEVLFGCDVVPVVGSLVAGLNGLMLSPLVSFPFTFALILSQSAFESIVVSASTDALLSIELIFSVCGSSCEC